MVARQKLGSERAIAVALNVKRHQLRRALSAMRANGEVAQAEAKRKPLVGHNGESLVRDTNPMEVIEMRIAIEPFLARLAALRASPFEMAAIEQAATTAAGADTGAADLKFHKLIAASSGNKLAASLYSLLRRVASDARVRQSAFSTWKWAPSKIRVNCSAWVGLSSMMSTRLMGSPLRAKGNDGTGNDSGGTLSPRLLSVHALQYGVPRLQRPSPRVYPSPLDSLVVGGSGRPLEWRDFLPGEDAEAGSLAWRGVLPRRGNDTSRPRPRARA